MSANEPTQSAMRVCACVHTVGGLHVSTVRVHTIGCVDTSTASICIVKHVELSLSLPCEHACLSLSLQGEPAYLLGPAVFFALKHAVYAARAANGAPAGWFALNAPATPEAVATACATTLQ